VPATASLYDYIVTPNVMAPMRDGVRLATDVYLPARNGQPVEGQWPVILYRVPYGTPHPARRGEFFARNGYVFLAQDSRGTNDSEGVFRLWVQEGPDGYDAVVWATKQPWSNGKVATYGGSYSGSTQLALAIHDPPGLVAQFIREMFTNAYKTPVYTGGVMRVRYLAWTVRQATRSQAAARDPMVRRALQKMADELPMWLERFPTAFRRGSSPLALVPNYEDFAVSIIENDTYGPFWQQVGLNVEEHWQRYADVPVYWLGGWYDAYITAAPHQYLAMTQLKTSPQKLIIGPWIHGPQNVESTVSGDADFGAEAALDFHFLMLRWYDKVVKGMETGILDEPPIRIFVMGGGDGHRTPEGRIFHGGQWRHEREWPLDRAQNTKFYLHRRGVLSQEVPNEASPPTSYTHDPLNPVPTRGGPEAFSYKGRQYIGGFDQREGIREGLPLRSRPDVLVFQTPALEEDVEVTGPMTATLYVSSSAVDTDFNVKLVDVYPPSRDWPEGYDLYLTDGMLRASSRESLTNRSPLEPGRVYELNIEVPPTSNVFARGHRIRVDIASSNFPRFVDVNYGTMDPPWDRRRAVRAENRVYHDPEHPSHIVFPIVPRDGTVSAETAVPR
jgi:putative CocE/NonD family hydrolase